MNTPEESAHLAAGMLAVGYKGVVATMWSIHDNVAPVVMDVFYSRMLALEQSGERKPFAAAYALHDAVRNLRDKIGDRNFVQWVPFIHYGR